MSQQSSTHCSQGHEWTEENTYIRSNGRRECKKCQYLRNKEYYFKNKRISAKICTQCGSSLLGVGRNKYCLDCAPREGYKKWSVAIQRYGVDKFMWDAMYFELNGTCPLCEEREVTDIDHCHETGKVRGLLCGVCNTSLHKGVSAKWLINVGRYLEEA